MGRGRPKRAGRLALALTLVGLAAGVLVAAAGALRFDDASYLTPTGVVGIPYTHRFTAPPAGTSGAGCDPPYIVQVDSGMLPPGLSLRADGILSGTPTQAGKWSFWVSIRDDPTDKPWCNPLSAEREFTIEVVDRLVIGPDSVGPGTVGIPYSVAMTATLSDPKTWSISAGALPPGLSLGTTSGVISGTPATAGSFPFTVRAVVDAERSDTKVLAIVVRDPLRVSAPRPFDPATHVARSEVGVSFHAALAAVGGSEGRTWSLATGGAPPGIVLTPDGRLTGKATAAGTYGFTVSAADDEGRSASLDAKLVVAQRLSVLTSRLAPASVGRSYRARLLGRGGVAPTRWGVLGRLPRGLRVDGVRGLLVGTPQAAGAYRFIVVATDALGVQHRRALRLVVRP